jgi:hypothetical protein
MALFEDMFKGAGASGLVIGIGAALLAPVVLPALGRAIKPAAKAALKTGIKLYRDTTSEVGRMTNELYQEAQAELAEGGRAATGTTRSGRSHQTER